MTDRQIKILRAIVEQYAEVAVPVGSVLLAKTFYVSSATIRRNGQIRRNGLYRTPIHLSWSYTNRQRL